MTSAHPKWQEYRRIRDMLYSVCWDCEKPCAICQHFARREAFGKPNDLDPFVDAACRDAIRAVTSMEKTGARFVIEVRQ